MSPIAQFVNRLKMTDAKLLEVVAGSCKESGESRFFWANFFLWMYLASVTTDLAVDFVQHGINWTSALAYVMLGIALMSIIRYHQRAIEDRSEKRGAESPFQYGFPIRIGITIFSLYLILISLAILLAGHLISGTTGVVSGFSMWAAVYFASYNPGDQLKAWNSPD